MAGITGEFQYLFFFYRKRNPAMKTTFLSLLFRKVPSKGKVWPMGHEQK